MIILNKDDFENFFDYVEITSKSIEEQILNYKLTFSSIKDDNVEWRMKFPTFLTSFYRYLYKNKTIPTQEEFWECYLKDNKKFFDKKNFDEKIILALKARVYRTYPSLVRDVHFTCYVKENLAGDVIYNRKLDVNDGIDMLIGYNNKMFAVNLFTATTRSFLGREKKKNRHKIYENIHYLELPVDFRGSFTCGQFFLYKETEYNKLINELDSVVYQGTYEPGPQL